MVRFSSLWQEKLRAAALHALVTASVALLTAVVVFGLWYPGQLAEYFGGAGLFILVLGVEVCLGPLLSIVIYNPAKPRIELIRDYVLIGLIQLAALIFGLHTTYIARPVYIVFVSDHIELVSALELDAKDVSGVKNENYRSLPLNGPEQVCVQVPDDPVERSAILLSSLRGKDIHLMPEYYRDCSAEEIMSRATPGAELLVELKARDRYEQIKSSLPTGDFLWLPVHSRLGFWVLIYPETGASEGYYLAID